MAYRTTERALARRTAVRERILHAAHALVAQGGFGAAEVSRRAAQHEVDAVIAAATLANGVETFARRALAGRRLAWALLAEPVDPVVEAERLAFRRAYRDAFLPHVGDELTA